MTVMSRQLTEDKQSCVQTVTGLVSRLVFTGSIHRTPHKPVASKTSEANIPLSSYDDLTDVGGLSQRKSACFLLNMKEASSGLIQVNDDEERNGGQAGRVYGCQLQIPGGIQSGLTNDWEL